MSDERNGRIATDAYDYLLHRQKKVDLADRRPAIRKGADIGLGPGLSQSATRITDYNNLLATFNGYYSSAPGALNAPNPTGSFIGTVVMDSELGGAQVFTDVVTGQEYRRSFRRYPGDDSTLLWGEWTTGADIVTKALPDFNTAWETGFYAAQAGASNAPVAQNLVGSVAFEEGIGGLQRFTEVITGQRWSRQFFGDPVSGFIWFPWTADNPTFKFGAGSFTTTSAGVVTITHGLGRVPTFASVETTDSNFYAAVNSRNATTISASVLNLTTNLAVPSTSMSLRWFVV